MTRFLKYLFSALGLCLVLVSCNDKEDIKPAIPQLPVNYINLAGNWQLVSFNGHPLEEDTYLYLTFERSSKHPFQMYDNLQSKYGQKRTGTYLLEEDEKTEAIILSGFYDNGVGAWNNEYTVTSLTADQLELTSTDAQHEVQQYQRIEKIPETLNPEAN